MSAIPCSYSITGSSKDERSVAPDQTIILGLQIFLGHTSLSSIGQNILIKLSHDETRFKKNKMRFMSEIKITEKKHFQILHDKSNIDGGDVDD